MRDKHKTLPLRLIALLLTLLLTLMPAVSALTPGEFKELLQRHYLNEVSDEVLAEETIDGIIEALGDPYTAYFTPEAYAAFLKTMTDEEIAGIGISIQQGETGVHIVEVFSQSPAAQLGLQVGDVIVAVEGKSTADASLDTVATWLQGQIDTDVTFTIRHADGREESYTTKRAKVVVVGTTHEPLGNGMGYINCRNFGEFTQSQFVAALEAQPQATSWLVDVRSNPGGDLNACVQSLGVFLGQKDLVYLQNGRKENLIFVSQQEAKSDRPVIILMSGNSASAAEVFSATMRDEGAALILGERSYGKGVAQAVLDKKTDPAFFPQGDGAKITAYRYFTYVAGNTADQIGVIPHLLVNGNVADEIAGLLQATAPKMEETKDFLRLSFPGNVWYLSLTEATKSEHEPYFAQLLAAIPPTAMLERGTAQGTWLAVEAEDLAGEYQLREYQSRHFSDLTGRADENALNTLATYGVIKGSDAMFLPDAAMTRAELCALLVQALNLTFEGKAQTFSDVSSDAWYADEVQAVVAQGYMKGVGEGNFLPNGTVTQEEMITVLARMATSLNLFFDSAQGEWSQSGDGLSDAISLWARPSVWLLHSAMENQIGQTMSFLPTPPDQMDSRGAASRSDIALTLYYILNGTGLLPA